MAWDVRIWQPMAHQKQETDVMGRIARVAGFIMLVSLFISLFFPAARRALAELGFVAVGLSLLVVMGLIGFGIYRLPIRVGAIKTANGNPFAPPAEDAEPVWNDNAAEASLELLGPALRRRYPWRH
jgi:hypothetical protein